MGDTDDRPGALVGMGTDRGGWVSPDPVARMPVAERLIVDVWFKALLLVYYRYVVCSRSFI